MLCMQVDAANYTRHLLTLAHLPLAYPVPLVIRSLYFREGRLVLGVQDFAMEESKAKFPGLPHHPTQDWDR